VNAVTSAAPVWDGPYWDARVLDEVWRSHGQRLIEAGWAITTALYRAYSEPRGTR